jgi:ribonuclease HI
MAKKQKYYVVWKGKHPGIFESWEDCKAQITGIKGAYTKGIIKDW